MELTHALHNGVTSNDLEWPWATSQNFQRHRASRGLSATALAFCYKCTVCQLNEYTPRTSNVHCTTRSLAVSEKPRDASFLKVPKINSKWRLVIIFVHVSCLYRFYRAMLCISAVYAGMRCLCVSVCGVPVCPLRSWVASKRIKISSKFFHHRVAQPF